MTTQVRLKVLDTNKSFTCSFKKRYIDEKWIYKKRHISYILL